MPDKRFDARPKEKTVKVRAHRRGDSMVKAHVRKFTMKDEAGREYQATKVYDFPKMTPHRGRSYDTFVNYINGEPVDMYLDTTWGDRYYFTYEGRKWTIPLLDAAQLKGHHFEIEDSKGYSAEPTWRKKKRTELDDYSELAKHVWELEGTDYEVRIYKYNSHYQVDLWKGDEFKTLGGENWAAGAKEIATEFMRETKDLDAFWETRRPGMDY